MAMHFYKIHIIRYCVNDCAMIGAMRVEARMELKDGGWQVVDLGEKFPPNFFNNFYLS